MGNTAPKNEKASQTPLKSQGLGKKKTKKAPENQKNPKKSGKKRKKAENSSKKPDSSTKQHSRIKPPLSPEEQTEQQEKERKRSRAALKKLLFQITESTFGLLVLAGIVASIVIYLATGHNTRTINLPELEDRPYFYWGGEPGDPDPAELHKTVISYLAVPDLVGPDILQQLNNSAAVVVFYSLEEERFYCAIPKDEFHGPEDFDLLTDKPGNVQRGRTKGGTTYLGEYKMKTTNAVFFSFPSDDLTIFPSARLSTVYKSAVYSLSLKELVTYHYNRAIYGGFYVNQCRATPDTITNGLINCGAFVAYPGEPSLKILIQQLADRDSSKENRIQQFLNFVTREIKDEAHRIKPPETIKKPNETLMTGSGGYHDKAILLASLLEQTDINYLIAYTDDSVAILVEGQFDQQRNALDLFINGKQYHLAAISARRFQVGQPAPPEFTADSIRYIQRPGINTQLIALPPPN